MSRMLTAAALLAASAVATAGTVAIQVDAAWSRALPPVADTGAAYVSMTNTGDTPDALVGVESPIARRTQIHEMSMEGGVMRMRPVASIPLAPGASLEMDPGGMHVMLMGLKRPLKEGDTFPLTLRFEKAPETTVDVTVLGMGAQGMPGGHMHGDRAGHGTTKSQ